MSRKYYKIKTMYVEKDREYTKCQILPTRMLKSTWSDALSTVPNNANPFSLRSSCLSSFLRWPDWTNFIKYIQGAFSFYVLFCMQRNIFVCWWAQHLERRFGRPCWWREKYQWVHAILAPALFSDHDGQVKPMGVLSFLLCFKKEGSTWRSEGQRSAVMYGQVAAAAKYY